jgi:hypothetical protein
MSAEKASQVHPIIVDLRHRRDPEPDRRQHHLPQANKPSLGPVGGQWSGPDVRHGDFSDF